MKPPFIKAIDDAVENIRFAILVQVIICLLIGLTNVYLQRFVIDSCVSPIIPTPPTSK